MTGDRPVLAVGGGGGVLPLAFDFRPIGAFYRACRLAQARPTSAWWPTSRAPADWDRGRL